MWTCFGPFRVGGAGRSPRPAHIPPQVTAAKWPHLRVLIRPPQPKTNFGESLLCGFGYAYTSRACIWKCFGMQDLGSALRHPAGFYQAAQIKIFLSSLAEVGSSPLIWCVCSCYTGPPIMALGGCQIGCHMELTSRLPTC